MTSRPVPARGERCPAAAVLDAHSAGEAVGADVERHVSACPACSAYVDELRGRAESFLKMRPPELFLAQLERREAIAARGQRSWLRRLAWTAPLAACAAIALVVLARPAPTGVEFKGAGLNVVHFRAGMAAPEPLGPDARVRPGDALRFAYTAPTDGNLLILELDGTGRATVFHPWNGARGVPVRAQSPDFLDGSVVLDDAPGPEWLVAVFSPEPVDAEPLLRELQRQAGAAEPKLSCRGCRVTTLRLLKEP